MMAMYRKNCTNMPHKLRLFDIISCPSWSPEYLERLHILRWLMILIRTLPKVVSLDYHATSGSPVTFTFQVGRWKIKHNAHTAKQSDSNSVEQHNTQRPTVALAHVLPSDHSSARIWRQLFSGPSSHNQQSRHTLPQDTCAESIPTKKTVAVKAKNCKKMKSVTA